MRLLFGFSIVVIIALSVCFNGVFQMNTKIDRQINKNLDFIKNISYIDAERQIQKNKVEAIIESHNHNFSQEEVQQIGNLIYEMTIKYSNLDVNLICAVITHESAHTWNPKIKSPVGAVGLMQIMPYTGRFLALAEGYEWSEQLLEEPEANIRMGCRYLSSSLELFGCVEGALVCYNGGPRWAKVYKKTNRIVPEETQGYVPAVLALNEKFYNL